VKTPQNVKRAFENNFENLRIGEQFYNLDILPLVSDALRIRLINGCPTWEICTHCVP